VATFRTAPTCPAKTSAAAAVTADCQLVATETVTSTSQQGSGGSWKAFIGLQSASGGQLQLQFANPGNELGFADVGDTVTLTTWHGAPMLVANSILTAEIANPLLESGNAPYNWLWYTAAVYAFLVPLAIVQHRSRLLLLAPAAAAGRRALLHDSIVGGDWRHCYLYIGLILIALTYFLLARKHEAQAGSVGAETATRIRAAASVKVKPDALRPECRVPETWPAPRRGRSPRARTAARRAGSCSAPPFCTPVRALMLRSAGEKRAISRPSLSSPASSTPQPVAGTSGGVATAPAALPISTQISSVHRPASDDRRGAAGAAEAVATIAPITAHSRAKPVAADSAVSRARAGPTIVAIIAADSAGSSVSMERVIQAATGTRNAAL
jgi:hypothetical protein